MPNVKIPNGLRPQDAELWQWAYTNYGTRWALAISKYKHVFKEKYGKNKQPFKKILKGV